MDAITEVADATGAMGIKNGVNGKLPLSDSLEEHGEGRDAQADGAHSGESEVINPSEEVSGEATSHSESRKPHVSRGSQGHAPKVVRSQWQRPRSGDESQARKISLSSSHPKAPIAQVSDPDIVDSSPTNGDTSASRKKAEKNNFRPIAKETPLLDGSKEKRKTQKSSILLSPANKYEEESTCAGTKPPRVGNTPSYGFTFKCDERAEKRKEFYSKLEEKIHAMELEKSNLQAQSKETEEAELKLLRKSLNFKATPMPSFYQEPPPPKVELKKIPPTRPRSPKLGRSKNTTSVDKEGTTTASTRPARLSLDERLSHNGVKKAPVANVVKKPQRKSLPKLPSEQTGSLDTGTSLSSTEQLENTEATMDLIQEPIRAEVTPNNMN